MSNNQSKSCSYVFDPDEVDSTTVGSSNLLPSVLNRNGVWRCPHPADESQDRCIFHRDPAKTDSKRVSEHFLDRIDESGRAPKQFIGARFGSLNLNQRVIASPDNYPIDLRHATFEAPTTWTFTVVRQPLNCKFTTFRKTADFTETRFENTAYFSGATFESDVRSFEAQFMRGGWFVGTVFDEANFHRAVFDGPADFTESTFKKCYFQQVDFDAEVNFNKSQFQHASFSGVRFADNTYFDQITIPKTVSFENSVFEKVCSVTELTLSEDTCYLNFQDTEIDSGRLSPVANGDVVFDLARATVGDVVLTEETTLPELLTHFRFLNTIFDGFDFGAYRDTLNRSEWDIHSVRQIPDGSGDESSSPSHGQLENTYLKAKNGANRIGDTKAAAEFFRREMTERRHQYAIAFWETDSSLRTQARVSWRWLTNGLLDVTTGYGERPSRVVLTSMATVGLFAGVFAAATPFQPYGSSVGPLLLSLESFVTLVLGGAETIQDPWIRLAAQAEGFIGAFLIALFVFTLTRSIHR